MRKNLLGKKVLSLVVAVAIVTSGFAVYDLSESNKVYATSNKASVEKMKYEREVKGSTEYEANAKVVKERKIKIEEIEYDVEDRELSVEFRTRVSWKNPQVKIYNAKGEFVCKGKIIEKDIDDIEVRLGKKLKYGKKYTCKISGIKARSASNYKTISKSFYAID